MLRPPVDAVPQEHESLRKAWVRLCRVIRDAEADVAGVRECPAKLLTVGEADAPQGRYLRGRYQALDSTSALVDHGSSLTHQYPRDPSRGSAVPQGGNPAHLVPARQDLVDVSHQLQGVGAHESVRAHRDRDGTLGVLSHREARDTKVSRLLLDSPRVRDHEPTIVQEGDKLEVAEGIRDPQTPRDRGMVESRQGARMGREEKRDALTDASERRQNST